MKKFFLSLLLCAFCCFLAAETPMPQFKDGDRVCFIGDSITHKGIYHQYIYLYYLTRFPDRKIEMFNCGISGDTAAWALARFDADIARHKPTLSTIMLGMNDVGRHFYKNDDPKNLAGRKQSLEIYRKDMSTLIERVQGLNSDIIFIGPSIYDETSTVKRKPEIGINGALIECSNFCKESAAKLGKGFVDFNQPMLKINAEIQKEDKVKTIVSHDRVHPSATGHLFMAYTFLKAQKVPGMVSSCAIDAATGKVTESENIKVTVEKASPKSVKFKALAKSLPFPWMNNLQQARKLFPFDEELNQETLKVTNLEPGNYQLKIDGRVLGNYSNEELAKGINLALLKDAPQNIQGRHVFTCLNRKYTRALDAIRHLHLKEKQLLKDYKGDKTNLAEIRKYLDQILEKTGPKRKKFMEREIKGFLSIKENQAEHQQSVEKLRQELYQLNQPKQHEYLIEKK